MANTIDPASSLKNQNLILSNKSYLVTNPLFSKKVQSTSRLFRPSGKSYAAKTTPNVFRSSIRNKYPFFKKNYKKTINLKVIVSKFFTRSALNSLRSFQKFSKLYQNRKLYLKMLNPNNMYGVKVTTNQLINNTAQATNKLRRRLIKSVVKSPTPFINKFFFKKIASENSLIQILFNPTLFKIASTAENYNFYKLSSHLLNKMYLEGINKESISQISGSTNSSSNPNGTATIISLTNLQPHNKFKFTVFKKIYAFFANNKIHKNIIPLYYHTLIRFVENCSGKKTLLQFYPFVNQCIDKDFIIRYKI